MNSEFWNRIWELKRDPVIAILLIMMALTVAYLLASILSEFGLV